MAPPKIDAMMHKYRFDALFCGLLSMKTQLIVKYNREAT